MTHNNQKPLDSDMQKDRAVKRAEWLNFCGRNRRTLLMLVGVSLLLLTVMAYRIANMNREEGHTHAESLEPELASISLLPELKEIVGHFEKNQTITDALLQQGLSNRLICEIVDCARPIYDLKKVIANRPYYVNFTQDGTFRDFRYPINSERYLTVYHDVTRDQLVSIVKDYQYEIRTENVAAVIQSSLSASVLDVGESFQLTADLADIFGYDIDFSTDIQRGDSFRAVVEKMYLDGKFVKNGAVLAASFSNKEKVFTGFRFEDENGKPAYYTPDGKALKRSFLKSPLKVYRITSRFSYSRRHPILKVVRPHLGVDYAAPTGTSVQAVSSGVVVSAGRKGANGNMIHLRHAGGYETKYLHLSKIRVKVGDRVDQGQIIGNVGSTGLSTGPHLDFRITKNGKPLNPTKLIFPPAKPISSDNFDRFAALRDSLFDEVRIGNIETQLAQQ